MPETIVRSTNISFTMRQVIWTLLGIIEGILGLRFLFRLIGANPMAGFVDLIYNISRPLVNPFVGIIRNTSSADLGVIEWSAIIAGVVYWLIAWAIIRLIFVSTTRPPTLVEKV